MEKCEEHGAPIIWVNGNHKVCLLEWLADHLEGISIRDLVPGEPFQLVLSNGETLPVQSISKYVGDQLQRLLTDPAFMLYELEEMGLVQTSYQPSSRTADGLGESNAQIMMEFSRDLSLLPEHPVYSPVVIVVDTADIMAMIDNQ